MGRAGRLPQHCTSLSGPALRMEPVMFSEQTRCSVTWHMSHVVKMRYPSFLIGFILCLQYEKHWHLTGRSLRSDSRSNYADSALIQGSELSVMMSDSRGLGREDTAPATSLILIRCNLEKCTYSWLYDPLNSLNINMSKKPQTFH